MDNELNIHMDISNSVAQVTDTESLGMSLMVCSEAESGLLAAMNKELIEDEQSDNQMTENQLKERMEGFLRGSYHAYLLKAGDDVVGYALCDMAKTPIYLRQFFIKREFRRRGYGEKAVTLLMKELHARHLDIEVYVWNQRGIAFWKSCGFRERSIYMRHTKQE